MNMKQDAVGIFKTALKGVMPHEAVRKSLEGLVFPGRVILVAVGKAAYPMAEAARSALPQCRGVVITKYGHGGASTDGLEVYEAGHPVPDYAGISATARVLEITKNLSPDDTVLFLVSGGGSALFEMPVDGVCLDDISELTGQLLACGADIESINAVRKRFSAVKGGRFAGICQPASVYQVVLSDVLGGDPGSIASGPASPDSFTSRQVKDILHKYDITIKPHMSRFLDMETPKEVTNVKSVITGSVKELCLHAADAAREAGYTPYVIATNICCEAGEAGRFMASVVRNIKDGCSPFAVPCAIIAGGETVVHLRGHGSGGRNQELALAAAEGIAGMSGVVLLSCGSDGTDGPTDAAGGIVDGQTWQMLGGRGGAYLDDNNSYEALKEANALVITGPTGTNVNDIVVALCV